MKKLYAGEMFAGYGGLALAIKDAFRGYGYDVETKWLAEFDEGPSKVLDERFNGIPNLGDVTAVDWGNPEFRVDLLGGSSPCQDVSSAGTQLGMTEGTRSNLWVAQRDAIRLIRPEWVVWENVRGACSAKAHSEMEYCSGCLGEGDRGKELRALGRVLGDLSELGYDARWKNLYASEVGAPHRRDRIFLVAKKASNPDSRLR